MATCAICGSALIEKETTTLQCPTPGKHAAGSPKVGSAILECPVQKGAIWVHVHDGQYKGIRLQVTAPGAKPTDGSGFASFDPLDPGTYTVKIDPSSLDDEYFPPAKNEIEGVPVRKGEITSVEFPIERVAPLKVAVDCPEGFPGDFDIKTAASENQFNPAHPMERGKNSVTFPKLRRHDYSVTFQLSEAQKKKYRIEGQGTKRWSHDPYGTNEVKYKVIALKLVSLEVIEGAKHLEGDKYWCVADSAKKVKVRAVTEPNDKEAWAQLTWNGAAPIGENNEALVDITNTGDLTVSATLDGEKPVTIEVYDIVKMDSTLPSVNSKYKAYKSDTNVTRLKVTTKPDEQRVWKHLDWSEGTPTLDKNECDVALKPVGDPTITASLAGKPVKADLHICQWPKLKIQEVTFECHEIHNDGAGKTAEVFDKKWIRGRPDPSTMLAASASQSPLCFTQGKKIKLLAKFEVVDKATDDEDVKVEAALGFGKAEGTVNVKAGLAEADLTLTESDAALPGTVDAEPAWTIAWTAIDYDGTTWVNADSSNHLRYVLLGDPLDDPSGNPYKIYFTILDISCVAARGKSTPDDLVEESFKPFAAAKGSGNGFARKGDNVRMSYYNNGCNTAQGAPVQTTDGMLNSADGTGRCGGWATLLIHMWGMHGVLATSRWFIRAVDEHLLNFDLRFLVKNCAFKATGSLLNDPYTHNGTLAYHDGGTGNTEIVKQAGQLPGHGQDNPQFDFGDHVVVKYNGQLCDPSYGVKGFATDDLYLAAALDGLGKWPKFDVTLYGVPQHYPRKCIPYNEGFAEYTIVLTPLIFMAQGFGMTGAAFFPHCEFYDSTGSLLTLPNATYVQPGYIAMIYDNPAPPRNFLQQAVVPRRLTLADIAAIHNVTEDQIFDDPKNAAIKATRLNKASLKTGDLIIVPGTLGTDAWRVWGHDQ